LEHVFETIVKAESVADELELDIEKAQHALSMLLAGADDIDSARTDKIEQKLDEAYTMLQNGRGDYSCKEEVLARLREIWKEIDTLQDGAEWPKTEKELNDALESVAITQERYGNDKTLEVITQLKQQALTVIQRQDVKLAKELIDHISSLDFMMVKEDIGLWVSFLKGFDDDFDTHDWKNRSAARRLIDEGKQSLATNPSKSKLQDIVRQLFSLLPEKEQPIVGSVDDKLLRK
jgi:hypothetical protein